MNNLNISLEEARRSRNNWMYVENLLDKDEYNYMELVELLNKFSEKIQENEFVKCQIFSEEEIEFTNLERLLSSCVDTEWDEPRIEFGKDLIWHPEKKEEIIKIDSLSKSLIAVYYSEPDYCLTIMSKEIYESRVVSNEVQLLLNTISFGDINLSCVEKNEDFKIIIDYLIEKDYAFAVYKNLVDDIEVMTIKSIVDWKQEENYSIEFTKKGREYYSSNKLDIEIMKLISL